MAEECRVFVYGSLLSGLQNHHWLGGARLVDGAAMSEEAFAMVFGGEGALGGVDGVYPYLIDAEQARPTDDVGPVVGEVYEIGEATLAKLDELEEHPVEYRRRLAKVRDHVERAWLYVYEDPLDDLRRNAKVYAGVPRRDWRPFLQRLRRR